MTNLERLKRDAQTWTALFFSLAAVGLFFFLAAAGYDPSPMSLLASTAAIACTVGGLVSSALLVAMLVVGAYRRDVLASEGGEDE